jgi:hypothetical protein
MADYGNVDYEDEVEVENEDVDENEDDDDIENISVLENFEQYIAYLKNTIGDRSINRFISATGELQAYTNYLNRVIKIMMKNIKLQENFSQQNLLAIEQRVRRKNENLRDLTDRNVMGLLEMFQFLDENIKTILSNYEIEMLKTKELKKLTSKAVGILNDKKEAAHNVLLTHLIKTSQRMNESIYRTPGYYNDEYDEDEGED